MVLTMNNYKNTLWVLVALSDFVETVLEFFIGGLPFDNSENRKKSLGQRLLPLPYRKSPLVVIAANSFLWMMVVLIIVLIVSMLS